MSILSILIPVLIWLWTGFSTNMAVEAGLMLLQALWFLCLIYSIFSLIDNTINCPSKEDKHYDNKTNPCTEKPGQNPIWVLQV